MLREVIQTILDGWQSAKGQVFKGHPLGKQVRNDFKSAVAEVIDQDYSDCKIKGSVGNGQWADVAWLSIINPDVTETTQDGFYPVYLFCADGSGAYLSLIQGTTRPASLIGKRAAKERASVIQKKLISTFPGLTDWGVTEIQTNAESDTGRSYEYGNIVAKFYSAESLPSDQELQQDLLELMAWYKQLAPYWNEIAVYEKNPEPSNTTLPFTPVNTIALPKPFMLLAGISGTGKTRFVRKQAELHDKTLNNYCLVSVRPDWHEPSDLLGYVSRLGESGPNFVVTDLLRFIVAAWCDVVSEVSSEKLSLKSAGEMKPYWLCLDEMNLAPVEQYFADYLSVLETRCWEGDNYSCDALLKPALFSELSETGRQQLRKALNLGQEYEGLWEYFCSSGISIPPNLLVAGTVNMDETTHGFSRKVIDRAWTIDFGEFYPNDFRQLFAPETTNKSFGFSTVTAASLSGLADVPADPEGERSIAFLEAVNKQLKQTPFELAYRALNELLLSVICFKPVDEVELQAVWDDFLMTKILPRIEGDSDKLQDDGDTNLLVRLEALLSDQLADIWDDCRPDLFRDLKSEKDALLVPCRSQIKLKWMNQRLQSQGFTAFWP